MNMNNIIHRHSISIYIMSTPTHIHGNTTQPASQPASRSIIIMPTAPPPLSLLLRSIGIGIVLYIGSKSRIIIDSCLCGYDRYIYIYIYIQRLLYYPLLLFTHLVVVVIKSLIVALLLLLLLSPPPPPVVGGVVVVMVVIGGCCIGYW